MKIKRFTEDVGFDDDELKYRYEIPNLMGEFDPGSFFTASFSSF